MVIELSTTNPRATCHDVINHALTGHDVWLMVPRIKVSEVCFHLRGMLDDCAVGYQYETIDHPKPEGLFDLHVGSICVKVQVECTPEQLMEMRATSTFQSVRARIKRIRGGKYKGRRGPRR